MKKINSLLLALILTVSFSGCSQTKTTEDNVVEKNSEPVIVEENIEPVEIEAGGETQSFNYVGYWLRTGVYADGELVTDVPATLDLRAGDYFSMGTCENGGKVNYFGDNQIELTLDTTNCPGVSAGGKVVYTYKIEQDEERNVETMVLSTGGSMETFDRQES